MHERIPSRLRVEGIGAVLSSISFDIDADAVAPFDANATATRRHERQWFVSSEIGPSHRIEVDAPDEAAVQLHVEGKLGADELSIGLRVPIHGQRIDDLSRRHDVDVARQPIVVTRDLDTHARSRDAQTDVHRTTGLRTQRGVALFVTSLADMRTVRE